MGSYEKDTNKKIREGKTPKPNIDISPFSFFWKYNFSSSKNSDNITRFLKTVPLLKGFSANQLRILSRYMHKRAFSYGDTIFQHGDVGVGFYIIYSGQVEIPRKDLSFLEVNSKDNTPIILEKFCSFGEIALVHPNSHRFFTAIAKSETILLAFLNPDFDTLNQSHPEIAIKLLYSVSQVVASNFYEILNECRKNNS